MRSAFAGAAVVAWLLAGPSAQALAQDAAPAAASGFEIKGSGLTTLRVSPASLASLPRVEQDVAFQTAKGEQKGHYGGVLLWTLMEAAGITELPGHHGELLRTFTVRGRDGYAIAFSVGEISPDFGATAAMIAQTVDGKPLPAGEGLRLIVPGDKRGARSVRDVVGIDVR